MSTFLTDSLRYLVKTGMYGTASMALIVILVTYLALSRRSTIRNIPGPPSPSWIFGHMLQLMMPPMYGDYEFKWQKTYGLVYRLKGCFGDQLMISDPAALKYILNSPHFRLGPLRDSTAHLLFGDKSVVTVNEHAHKRLRAALNVGFTAAAVRNHLPVFEKVAQMLTDWLDESSGASTDICPLLSLATISAVTEAILGYPAKDLGEEFLANNFQALTLASNQSAFQILAHAVATGLPTRIRDAAIRLPTRTYKTLLTSQLLARLGPNADFYSQLLDVDPSDKTKNALTGEEIAGQTAIILIAGQDTTASALAFALLELAKAPELQDKLRAEIHSTSGLPAPAAFHTIACHSIALAWGTVYNGDAFGPYANLLTFLGGPRMAFCALEMQVFICELVAKFSFALPEGEPVGTRFATTLQPIMSNGQKGAPLCIKRIV
ncbi:cytochrome P450 [Mycena leptocephala]|nr:cytochrome P450 [Mycena leptocephala]